MSFHFASADDPFVDGQISKSATPSSGTSQGANGVGRWIERMSNVQSRSAVPHAKRRKTEDGQDFAARTDGPSARGSSGLLGDDIKNKRGEADGAGSQQALTVDLTGGESHLRQLFCGAALC